jgi:hypothetical protein
MSQKQLYIIHYIVEYSHIKWIFPTFEPYSLSILGLIVSHNENPGKL